MSDVETTWSPPKGSVLIAGVGSPFGLGAAIARRFAAGGYPVAVALTRLRRCESGRRFRISGPPSGIAFNVVTAQTC